MQARPRGYWAVLFVLVPQLLFGAPFIPKVEEKRSRFIPVCAALFLGSAVGGYVYQSSYPEDVTLSEVGQLAKQAGEEIIEFIHPKERRRLRDRLLETRARTSDYCQFLAEEVRSACMGGARHAHHTSMHALAGIKLPASVEEIQLIEEKLSGPRDDCYELSPRHRDAPSVMACLTSYDRFATMLTDWLKAESVDRK